MTQKTELKLTEDTEHIKKLNKLTSGAKTDFILKLQKDDQAKTKTITALHEELKDAVDQINAQTKTIAKLRNDIQTIQARHIAEERMSSSMKSAFIAVQDRYIKLLEKHL